MEGVEKPKGKYVPPAMRKAIAEGTAPVEGSKFERFLSSRSAGTRLKAESEWGHRDYRDGYIDSLTQQEDEELFKSHSHDAGINFDRYEEIPVEVSESVKGIERFEECALHPTMLENIRQLAYSKPTPVQKFAIQVGFERKDLMACAQTGSGKTAAYLFPICAKMLKEGPPAGCSRQARPVTMVLAPTRELAMQIGVEARKFVSRTGIRVVVVYGGADPKLQARELDRGCDIVVATPGRLLDFQNRGRLGLSMVKYVVLDEADRMLDMGFEPQIRSVLESEDMRHPHETTMVSATFPREIQQLAVQFLRDYIFLAVGRVGSTSESIAQELVYVEEEDKKVALHELLQRLTGLVLVFVETKRSADYLDEFLFRAGYSCTSIHGDRTQPEREAALKAFKSGQRPILVATDVAARGLDIPNVANIINYDLPNAIDDYVHRIGRTGRIGKEGRAYSFVNEKNSGVVKDLYSLLCETNQAVPEWFERMFRETTFHSRRSRGRGFRSRW